MLKKINTIVDGYDVKEVNLWPSPTDRTKKISFCTCNEVVFVLDRKGDYSRVRNAMGKIGWCNTGFLIDVEENIGKEYPMDSDISIDKAFYAEERSYTEDFRKLLCRTWLFRLIKKLGSLFG